ncbi:MAG: Gfo/Idh/MocA family oxidoreductase [Myxococcota bacterium]
MRVALIGCGVMGSRHAAVLASDPDVQLVTVDLVPERSQALAERFRARAAPEVPDDIDAAVIATPSTTHADIAGPLLARGVWCLVEKPIAHSRLAAHALTPRTRCAVGHIERFNPAILAAGPMRPRVVEGRRIAPPTGRGLDVDVVMDLMIHDLDLVLRWAEPGADVSWIDATGVGADRQHPDTASVRLRTTCGMTVSLLASRVAEQRQRVIRCYEPARNTVLDLAGATAQRNGVPLPVHPADPLTHQWSQFAAAVRGEAELPSTDGAVRAVEIAERITAVITQGWA